MSELWRIDELQAVTEQALAAALPDADLSGRVRAVPDARTIRYYTTLGMLDRAAEMRGRIAFYGRRHVLQLVAIKQLQATGMSLEQVQQKLAGATTRRLTDIAALPEGFFERPLLKKRRSEPPTTAPDRPAPARALFWSAPAAVAKELPLSVPQPISCVRLQLAPGVSLEIAGAQLEQLTPETANQLKPALDHLSQELHRLGLMPDASSSTDSPTTANSSHSSSGDSL
jgi:DNA-binding transcriptional MerR regulator